MNETPTQQAPMTALQGFNLLAKDVLPKLIKRIAACEAATNIDQNGVSEQRAYQAAAKAIEDKLADTIGKLKAEAEELRASLIEQLDDMSKRVEELERVREEQVAKNEAKVRRMRKKKTAATSEAPVETPVATPDAQPQDDVTEEQIVDALLADHQAEQDIANAVQDEPPVILEDPVPGQDELADAMNFASQMAEPATVQQPAAPSPDVIAKQIRAIAAVGALPLTDIAARFNVTVDYVQSVLAGE